jgi:hypothetical protein
MFTTFTVQNPCKGNQIKKNVTGGACSTYGGEKNCMQKFGGENTKERDNSEYVGGYGIIIQMRIKQTGREEMLWIDLPEDRAKWCALGDTVTSNANNFSTS